MPEVQVTAEDVQAVMQSNPTVALQVENHALKRIVVELQNEIGRLKLLVDTSVESGASLGESTKKESLNANSRA
jgi:hypothetical protein